MAKNAPIHQRSLTKDAVRLRNQRVATTYIETGGDVAATAQRHHVSERTVREIRQRTDLKERFWEAVQAREMTIEQSIGVLQDAHGAELVLTTPTGEVIRGLPDHKTRITAARAFLGVAVALERMEEPEPAAPPPPPTRPLTIEEFMALPQDRQMRVVMERTRVLVEPQGIVALESGGSGTVDGSDRAE